MRRVATVVLLLLVALPRPFAAPAATAPQISISVFANAHFEYFTESGGCGSNQAHGIFFVNLTDGSGYLSTASSCGSFSFGYVPGECHLRPSPLSGIACTSPTDSHQNYAGINSRLPFRNISAQLFVSEFKYWEFSGDGVGFQ